MRNVALLREVREVLDNAEKTGRHDQGVWVRVAGLPDAGQPSYVAAERLRLVANLAVTPQSVSSPMNLAACGTVGCVAGWLSFLYAADIQGAYIDVEETEVCIPARTRQEIAEFATRLLARDWEACLYEDAFPDVDDRLIARQIFGPDQNRGFIIEVLDAMIAHPQDSDAEILERMGGMA
jgi:hypothetical protein